MKRKKNYNPFNWRTALALSIIIALILNILSVFTSIEISRIVTIDMSDVYINAGMISIKNVVTFFILYMFAFKVIQAPIKPWIKGLLSILGTLLLACVISLIVSSMWASIIKKDEYIGLYFIFRLVHDLIVATIVLLSTSQIYIMNLRQKTLIENEKLVAENIRNRYEALKNQVDPHFLFNSLNTLNGLIGYDDDRAHKYVEKLSSVFRYTIQNKETITLREELDFTVSYAYLMKIRYGENFQIEHDIAEKYFSYYIMPISVQLQVENAIKHNVISNKYPLNIRIGITDSETLTIENDIQAKTLPITGTGIGLANLAERYKLLFQKEVAISNTNNVFRVEIPLISPEKVKEEHIKTKEKA